MEKTQDQLPVVIDATVGQMHGALALYDDLAGSEPLTRALIAERTGRRHLALLRVAVFQKTARAPVGND